MTKLKAIISMELLTYKRSKIIYFIVLILMFYIGVGYYHYLRNDYIEAGQMLQSSSYINNKSVLPFTLYHRLNVSSVEINGELAEYKREGDWIYVQLEKDMETLDISFQINGNTGDLCPITENSFFLSPTFPWYPVPGIFIIAEKSFYNYEAEFKNVHLNEPAEFYIVTDNKDLVFSNIEKIGQNEFHGFSKGAGLFSGMLISKGIDGKRYLAPPDRINIIKSSLSIIERKISFISNIVDRPIRIIPETICVKPYIFLFAIIFLTLERDYVFQFQDIYFPILSIFFYSGFSFLSAVIAKNTIISFTVLGIFSVFVYSTRGGVSACIYPFQWSNPNPYYNPVVVALALIVTTSALYASANFFFNNREFLMKK